MKKTICLMLIVLLLCTALSPAVLAAEDDLVGTWYLTDMDDGSGEDNAEKIALMNSLGISATMEIRADGSATIDLFGESHDFTVDFKKGLFRIGDNDVEYILKDGALTFGDDEMTLTFSRQVSAVSGKPGTRVFDYYEFLDMVDYDGTKHDIPPELVNLVIFEDGKGVLTSGSTVMDLEFDFEKKMIASEGETVGEFTLEDGLMTIDDGEYILRFRLGDPGFAGPYILSGMLDEDGNDLSEQLSALSLLGMMPRLTIDEDGHGVMEFGDEKTELFFDFDKMLVTSEEDDGSIAFTYENGSIVLARDEASLTFRRVMSEEAEEAVEETQPTAEEKDPDERDPSEKGK